MAAAVADLRVEGGQKAQKIEKKFLLSSFDTLQEVPDLLKELALKKPKNQVLLGFAALTGDDDEIKRIGGEKLIEKGCDLLMANPIDRAGQGLEVDANGGWLLSGTGEVRELKVTSKLALAHELLDALLDILKTNSAKL